MARFAPGDNPSNIGPWQLVELVESDSFGEGWKAIPTDRKDGAPALLKFCLNPTAKDRLSRRDAKSPLYLFAQLIKEGKHAGIRRLRRLHLNSDPPCFQYQYFEGSTLGSLIREWQEANQTPDPNLVVDLLKKISEPLGFLHRLQPPIVHSGLTPETIRLRRDKDNQYQIVIADAGLSMLAAPAPRGETPAADTQSRNDSPLELCLSPQARRGNKPHTRDDVYSLGIIWFQMACANTTAGRPGGSQWRKRLTKAGMSTALIELLESCFEDELKFRPIDAAALVEDLDERMAADSRTIGAAKVESGGGPPTLESKSSEAAPEGTESQSTRRARSRRSDVWDLFDTIEKKAPELSKILTNSIGMKLVMLPKGVFQMGTNMEEFGCRENEMPRHEVSITKPFYLAVTPITQQQYKAVMGNNPSRFNADNGGGPEHPVEKVTWENAVAFCDRMSALPAEKEAHRHYRLPTEAEWEYACRAGTTTPFSFGESLTAKQANFDGNFPYGDGGKERFVQKTTRVDHYPANHFGLCDMHGNVWEWCADWFGDNYYEQSPRRDPTGPETGRYRVLRGGSWRNHAATCRCGYRNALSPRLKDSATGFRIVLEIENAG